MKTFKLALVSAALASAASAGWAQDKAALIKEFIEIQKPGYELLAQNIAQQEAAPVLAASSRFVQERVPADKRETVAKAGEAEVQKYFDAVVPIIRDKVAQVAPGAITPVLEQEFSAEELKMAIDWMKSSASRKLAGAQPKMVQAIMTAPSMSELESPITTQVKRLDDAMVKALGVPADGGSGAANKKAPAKK
ncbi:DUF2059 domain-containing protein [Xenophilus sp.]|uniref:DUF2059 domain-containing protein n=1 Tax=Xenophilus sp. TaxID=1873499 RepID=UPI0037DCEC86